MMSKLAGVFLAICFVSTSAMSADTAETKAAAPAPAPATTAKPSTHFKVNPHAMVFKDSESDLKVEMALREDKNSDGLQDALLKITGAAAANEKIDGKVMYYTASPAGTGSNLSYMKDGSEHVRMTTRETWGSWKNFEVYVDGKTFHVYMDEKLTKKADAKAMLAAYKKSAK